MPTVNRAGRLTSHPMSAGEKNDILVALAKPGATAAAVAKEFGRDISTINRLIAQFKPTDALARATLMSRLSEMVERVVDKADVDQLISVLSRSNVGILAPENKSTGGSGPNIYLSSVQVGTLAAVNSDFKSPDAIEGTVVNSGGPAEGRPIRVGAQLMGESSVDRGNH
jgi:transposase-like protein